jgi:hypothetical protein
MPSNRRREFPGKLFCLDNALALNELLWFGAIAAIDFQVAITI